MRHDELFKEGEEVVIVAGPYDGTPGVFLRLRADVRWADISERNGRIRRHPVSWLAHAAGHVATVTACKGP